MLQTLTTLIMMTVSTALLAQTADPAKCEARAKERADRRAKAREQRQRK